MTEILVLASGRGSNFRAVIEAIESGRLSECRIIGLITDREGTGGADLANEKKIPVTVIDFAKYTSRALFDLALEEAVADHSPDLILTLGYMRLLNGEIVKKYLYKIINIHPSLLPSFPGMKSQKQAFDYGVRITGATVHFMDEGVDTGPVILQKAVDVEQEMTVEELSREILKAEHKILVDAIRLYSQDRLEIQGRKVVIRK